MTALGVGVDRIDGIGYAAAADIWAAAPAEAVRGLGLIRARHGRVTVVGCDTLPGVAMLNRVLGADPDAIASGDLEAAIATLHRRGCVAQVSVRDGDARGAAVRAWLESRGYVDGYAWMLFAYPEDARRDADPPDLRVVPCGPGTREAFGAVFAAGYELPPAFAAIAAAAVGRQGWHCYLATLPDGTPAGAGAMFVDGDAAWLGLGATLPAARRRGAQGALLRRRVDDALAMGCTLITTETGERAADRPSHSYRNILRAGFVEHGLRPNLVAPSA